MHDPLSDALIMSIGHLPIPTIVSRASTTEIVAANAAAVELFGYRSLAEFLSLDVATITDPQFRVDLQANYTRVFDHGFTTVKRYLRADGSSFLAQIHASSLADHPGLAIAVVVDIEGLDALVTEANEPPLVTG